MRMQLPPSYVVVGAYRLLTDQKLLKPTWDKCRHATRRGAIVGGIWARYLICPGLSSSHFFSMVTGFFDVRHSEKVHPSLPTKVHPSSS